MPVKGGLLDQPHILMMTFDIIHEERNAWLRIKQVNAKLKAQHEKDQQDGTNASDRRTKARN